MAELPEDPLRPSARELVRKRSRTYRAPETGRMHHIGGAPETVPVHTEDGVVTGRTTSWQLADRTVLQLEAQRGTTARQMELAAGELDFEGAARCRDELAALDAELQRRSRTRD